MRRRRNEDAVLDAPELGVVAVADGMGGHAAGNVASRIAVETLRAAFAPAGPPQPASADLLQPVPVAADAPLAERLRAAFDAANDAILQHAALQPECAGMGTTLTALASSPREARCVIAHIGDSRAYRLRAGALVQLTRDHTWVQRQVDDGMLTPAQARSHPMSSVLSRVLGTHAVGAADTLVLDALPDDLFLLCSDGLTNMLDDEAIAALLAGTHSLQQTADALIAAANARGGHDNITALLLAPEPG